LKALRHWSVRHATLLKRVYDVGIAVGAPALRGLVRTIGRDKADAVVAPIERLVKGTLFDCQMCGQCALSATGMSCPTNCAKQMRNGPCGGVRADGACEVIPEMKCVWVEAIEGRKRLAAAGIPSPPMIKPIDRRMMGSSSWVNVAAGEQTSNVSVSTPSESRGSGGSAHHVERSGAHAFERACRSNRFVVTVEISPPDSADPEALLAKARVFDGLADAMNVTDGAGGNCHMSSVAASAILATNGFTPVYQMSCRDRNRIAMQGDLIGAAALGVRNVLCLTGDDVINGDQPEAKRVFDLDSVSLLRIASGMRDRGEFASGRKLAVKPDIFLGATTNPFVPPYQDRIANLAAKIDAGARFIQTQFCFDMEMFDRFMDGVRAAGLHHRAAIIVGVGALNSAKALARMPSLVPGVRVPQHVVDRIAAFDDQKAAGEALLIETLRDLASVEGVAGMHVMGFRNERLLADAIIGSGVRQMLRPGSPNLRMAV